MKRKIRYNVFETNSSSTHAICIGRTHSDDVTKDDNLDELVKFAKFWNLSSDDGTCELKFKPHEYGWEVGILSTHEEKADYLYQFMMDLYDYGSDKFNESCKFISDTLQQYDIKSVFKPPKKSEYGIDHFIEMDTRWIEKCLSDSKYLLHYLFDNSVVITGNDNNMEFGNIMSLIDEDKCDIYYKGN